MKEGYIPWIKKELSISAEIQTLEKLYNEKFLDTGLEKKGKTFKVFLLATDSIHSIVACELIKEFLEESELQNISVHFSREGTVLKGMKIDDAEEFRQSGIMNLFEQVHSIWKGGESSENIHKKKGTIKELVILNISGGYKAMAPFMVLMGLLYQIPTVYMYEGEEELLEFPQLPFRFAFGIMDEFQYFAKKESFVLPTENSSEGKVLRTLVNDYHLFSIDKESSKYSITALGDLFSEFMRRNHLESDRVLGQYVELLMYKELSENRPYEDRKMIHSREISCMVEGKEIESELDFLFDHESAEDGIIFYEVKSARLLIDFGESVKTQILKQLKILKHLGEDVKQAVLVIYFTVEKYQDTSILDAWILEISEAVREFSNQSTEFAVKYMELKLKPASFKDSNPYLALFSGKNQHRFQPKPWTIQTTEQHV
ncbi:hypothetical protein [Pontibacter sp. G13]|uniref:hypothetical protein n=1 Tax=Pontibacter sp. G13 TaxID=3074898 RepID=UPI00288AE915|nr:hypothetical protein [Pontibacter sp. G13]WNJ18625.1 hypothetical protein RJD25_27530 [Pontibacter sp. G13]